MRYEKVLLVNPRISKSYLGPVRPPASLGYIAQSLEAHGIRYEVMDMALGYGLPRLWGKIESFKPDLIGLTIWTYRHKETYRVIEAMKKRYPRITIAAGGPHLSTMRRDVIKDCKSIDFGVVLEGERTIVELCQGKPFEEIRGMIYRRDGEYVYTGDRGFEINLDSVPFPRYDKFELKRYILEEILLISSRGCPFNCIYCPVGLAIGKTLRVRSARNIVDEIEYWYNRGYRRFNFGDDNFTFFKDRVYEICAELIRRGLKELDLRCGNGVRADKVDRDLLQKMKEVGFTYIGLGVEGGNNRVLQRIRKNETIEEIEETIRDACQLGYDVTLFFLAGSPGETWSDIKDSANLAQRYPVMDARFYNIVPYPGTELFEWLKKNNLLLRPPEAYLNDATAFSHSPIFETPELPAPERVRALKWLKKVERGILRRTLRRKLKKYGLTGAFIAAIVPIRALNYLARHNRFMRRMAEKMRYGTTRACDRIIYRD